MTMDLQNEKIFSISEPRRQEEKQYFIYEIQSVDNFISRMS